MFNINTEFIHLRLGKTCMPVTLPHRQCLYIKVKYPITPKHRHTETHIQCTQLCILPVCVRERCSGY